MRAAALALACFLVGACFQPAPHEGFACGFDDWCPGPLRCAADHTCRSANPPGDGGGGGDDGGPPGSANYAFVTSKSFLASDLMNVNNADQECMKAAMEAKLPMGHYVAWLSVSGQNVHNRLGDASGWIRTDGKPFARSFEGLTAGDIFYPLRKTETRADLADLVLTGTDDMGVPTGEDCLGLTSRSASDSIYIGESTGTISRWTKTITTPCDQSGHLYCLQIDHQQPVMPVRESGPLAFLGVGYKPGGGLTGADDFCMAQAASFTIPGTFRALLSTMTVAAIDRFKPLPSTPWVRPDGVATTKDFVTWDAPINVTLGGAYVGEEVYSGAESPMKTSLQPSMSCNDWTNGSASFLGRPSSASKDAFGSITGDCQPNNVYCLQVP